MSSVTRSIIAKAIWIGSNILLVQSFVVFFAVLEARQIVEGLSLYIHEMPTFLIMAAPILLIDLVFYRYLRNKYPNTFSKVAYLPFWPQFLFYSIGKYRLFDPTDSANN